MFHLSQCKINVIKHLEEDSGENFYKLKLVKDFLNTMPKAESTIKGNVDNLDFIKLKNFYSYKGHF